MVSPRASAVFRLITSSNVVGCSTGRSAGFAPFRILSLWLKNSAGSRHVATREQAIKCQRVFGVTVVDHMLFAQEEPIARIRQLSAALLHEGRGEMRRNPRDMHASGR